MEPTLPHVVRDPSTGTVLRPLDGEVPNVNPKPRVLEEKRQKTPIGAQPVDRINEENGKSGGLKKETKEIKEIENVNKTRTKENDRTPVDNKEERRVDPWKEERSTPTRTPRISIPRTTTPRTTPRPSTPRTTPKPRPSTPKPTLPRSGGGIKVGRG